jgi:hypothetical protein
LLNQSDIWVLVIVLLDDGIIIYPEPVTILPCKAATSKSKNPTYHNPIKAKPTV